MPNHFHFCIKQNSALPISKLLLKVCTSYCKYFNKKYNKIGGLLQSKFKAVLIDSDSQLLWLSAYIHQNPHTAGLVENLEDYKWSSYLDYIDKRKGNLCDFKIILNQFSEPLAYKKFVDDALPLIKQRKNIQHLLLDEP
jgi:putative transposase